MKKLIFLAVFAIASITAGQAQEIAKNALGLRLGDNDGFGGEISYQRGLGDNNRLEFDLGWRNSNSVDAIKLAGLYQWVWNIDGGFNWYAGAGGGLGSWSWDNDHPAHDYDDSGAFVFVAGDLGIEYNFDIPLILSIDFRPEIYFNSDDWRNDNFGPDLALGIRYQF
ncbi:hypothetical protein [Neptunitalea lumnitzerae]|uniref:Outer membrane protein beta-barrel domain-containing protein n=1 Tax=Neptunitalea lumnitzerae TaxID=2965509 RepID=A0ABQ5MJV3_9FLAO|nr:hypothetical protein [Neptunitalea sp. Y10]GLB49696.1 hypothetical protein Y10_20640 [Neptunitalea sp. Y10]